MTTMLRFEIMIDSVATEQILPLIRPFKRVNCTVVRAYASQCCGNTVNSDDLSDSLSHHLVTLFVPKEEEQALKKKLSTVLTKYSACIYQSECQMVSFQEVAHP